MSAAAVRGIAALALLCGCRDAPPRAPVFEPPASEAALAVVTAPDDPAEPEEVVLVVDEPLAPETTAPPPELPAGGGVVFNPAEDALVEPARCEAACAHTLRLVLAELPGDTAADVRAALTEAMGQTCRSGCLERATPEELTCILAARTTGELGACTP